MTRLLIIRHGETVWNAEGRIQGQVDTELNEIGRGQARAVGRALRRLGVAVDAVVSSDLSRASETADLIAAGACPRAKRIKDVGLREINFGRLHGEKAADSAIKSCRGEVYDAWHSGVFTRAFPGGEDGEALMTRGLRSLRVAADLGSCVVVVSHGGLIRWSAVAMALRAGAGADGPLPPPEQAKLGMAEADVEELLAAKVRNCCCSTVVYDHAVGRFRPEGWFRSLSSDTSAMDDTG